MTKMTNWKIFGHVVSSDFAFATALVPSHDQPDVSILSISAETARSWETGKPYLLYASEQKAAGGEPAIRLYGGGNGYILIFQGTATFLIRNSEILYQTCSAASLRIVELCILGYVMALWLELQGILAIHASAVVIDGKAACFCRGARPGKSTSILPFITDGYELLTDDILPLTLRDDVATGFPGYPQIKLWPAEAKHFFGSADAFEIVHPGYSKVRVDGKNGSFGFCERAIPVASMYILDNAGLEKDGESRIRSMGAAESIMTLVQNSFVSELVEAMGLQPERMKTMSRLCRSLRICRLGVHANYEHLPELKRLVLEDMGLWRG